MPDNDTKERLKQFLRATFPYLVFSAVFILGMLLVMLWAYGAEHPPLATLQPRAHSHNDYERERPLQDALDLGFCSVEADIHLVEGTLLVAHDRDDVEPGRTLQDLYLNPLWERFKANSGYIYPEPAPFTLLIDIKSEGAAAFAVLNRALEAYAPMLTHFTEGITEEGAVTVIISGDRATDTILASTPRRVGIDGRLADLDGPVNPHQMPLISDNWFRHFTWLGHGAMPDEEAAKLNAIVAQSHEMGVRLRFWAIPQREAVWSRLYDAGVDLLNADDLEALHAVLIKKAGPPATEPR